MSEDYQDIRDVLQARGLSTSTVEFIINNAKITGRADRLRTELGVKPSKDV